MLKVKQFVDKERKNRDGAPGSSHSKSTGKRTGNSMVPEGKHELPFLLENRVEEVEAGNQEPRGTRA